MGSRAACQSRGCRENRCNLEAPRHFIDAGEHETVALISGHWAKVHRIEWIQGIRRPVAECRRIPLVGHTLRQYIAAVDAKVMRKAPAERHVKAVVARAPDGLFVVDPTKYR